MDFVEQLKEVRLKKEESMVSYDVIALYTSVPISPALKIIEDKLIKDKDLQHRKLKVKVKVMDLYSAFQMDYALPKVLYM